MIQESFAEFDVPWRNDLVAGWNPLESRRALARRRPRASASSSTMPPIANHPYVAHAFPSLWDRRVANEFHSE